MNLERRLLTPIVSVNGIRIHEQASVAYDIWASLPRQFKPGALVRRGSATPLEPIHAIRDRRGIFHAFAAFATYQSALVHTSDGGKAQFSVLHYPHLDGDDVERLALEYLLESIESTCLDKANGLEGFRTLINEEVDKRTMEALFGTSRVSRRQFAQRAGISTRALKSQHSSSQQPDRKGQSVRRIVAERLT